MNIAVTTPQYVASIECSVIDGLVSLGHKVYNLNGPPLNYAECWPIPSPDKIDVWFMLDTDNHLGLVLEPDKMGPALREAKKVIFHCHDRFTDYINAPNSPTKPVPIEKGIGAMFFVRDLDEVTKNSSDKPIYPLDYAIERRYTEACAPFIDGERKNEIIFLGTLSTAHRQRYLDAVKRKGLAVSYGTYEFNQPDGKWSKWIYGRYTHDPRYYETLCKYMFVFCGMGAGVSTMRMAETYASGCIPVIQRYPEYIVSYYDFRDGDNCILWESEKDLVEKLSHWMNKPNEAQQLRERCYQFGQDSMLSSIVAQDILDKCKLHEAI